MTRTPHRCLYTRVSIAPSQSTGPKQGAVLLSLKTTCLRPGPWPAWDTRRGEEFSERGAQIFWIMSNTFFQMGEKFSWGWSPPVYGLVCDWCLAACAATRVALNRKSSVFCIELLHPTARWKVFHYCSKQLLLVRNCLLQHSASIQFSWFSSLS